MRERAPWWMWFLAASFLAWGVFSTYIRVLGPESIGAAYVFRDGQMVLRRVPPDSCAARAGLQPGDVLLAAGGISLRKFPDWMVARGQMELGQAFPVEFEREGKRRNANLVPTRRMWETTSSSWKLLEIVFNLVKFATLGVALLIAWRRPDDKVALLAAWLLATAVSGVVTIHTGMAATWRHLPPPLLLLLLFPFLSNTVFWSILFSFFAAFPRQLFTARWAWAAAWTPSLVIAACMMPNNYRIFHDPASLRDGVPGVWLLNALLLVFTLYALAAIAVMVVNYRGLTDVNQRRRVRVLVAGSVVSFSAAMPAILAANVAPGQQQWRFALSTPVQFALLLLMMCFPLSVAYAVLRHRVFDLRIIVRQGLQYALARYALLAIVPALAGLLVLDVLAHGGQTVAEVLRSRGWIYAALAALALVAHSKRQTWLDALDRRFFRDRYDAQRLLRAVVEDLRATGSFEQAAAQVAGKMEAALHAEFAAVYLKEAGDSPFSAVAVSPPGSAPASLAADAKFIGMIRLLETPLHISAIGEWQQRLPASESTLLRDSRLDLLIPIAVAAGRREALLALGPKKSEEPYSREDLDMLSSIAASLALLLERPQVAVSAEEAFQQCPECGLCYELGATTCAQHKSPLVTVRAPRMVSGRYRLERCIGRGGMGAVYAALDTALERRVAAKLIREDLVGSAQAADRFRREAKAAAAFTHPNVVTVHDFGVAGGRAFLIMELLEGRSLRQELQRSARLEAARLCAILRGVCSAVEAAHRRNLIHRDLKPENVFLAVAENEETPKVLDFGLVKTIREETQVSTDTSGGVVVGTVPYMSPEQLRGDTAWPGFDVWALTVIAYECLTGALPFVAKSTAAWAQAVSEGRFTRLASHLPDAPARWQEFFTRALSPQIEQRPRSAAEWLVELERALAVQAAARAR